MSTFTKAYELLNPGETALCLFTDADHYGHLLKMDDKAGSSCCWALDNPQRHYDRVIIFKVTSPNGRRHVEIIMAFSDGHDPVTEGDYRNQNRYTVRLIRPRHMGTTDASWESFVESDKRPGKIHPEYVIGKNAV